MMLMVNKQFSAVSKMWTFLVDVSKWNLNSQYSLDLLWIVVLAEQQWILIVIGKEHWFPEWHATVCGNVSATYSMLRVIQSVVKGVILFATDGRLLTDYVL